MDQTLPAEIKVREQGIDKEGTKDIVGMKGVKAVEEIKGTKVTCRVK